MNGGRILVVDDKDTMRSLLQRILGADHQVTLARDGAEALAWIGRAPFDVVLTDIKMPGADGFQVLAAVRREAPDTEVVMMTAYGTVEKAVEAIKGGAYDYLQKPFDPDDAVRVVARALERKRLRDEAAHLREALAGAQRFDRLIGKSPAMQEVFGLLDRAAQLDITVLLEGASGTGKELAARAIHDRSARGARPFVPVNCGALPGELVESELFGHARGAFTGAATARPGLFREADGGTLFLDEVGELPAAVQVKLNRALQEGEIRPVGETRSVKVDVRVIAATLRDLRAEVDAGRFREDLYYRLNVFPVRLPPLRERQSDIPLLAGHLLEKHARAQGRAIEGFDADALAALTTHAFPGNVRELENVVERAVAVCTGKRIDLGCLPAQLRQAPAGPPAAEALVGLPYKDAVRVARDQGVRAYLDALMQAYDGNVTRAARHAGVERESLHRLLRKHGLHSDDFKP